MSDNRLLLKPEDGAERLGIGRTKLYELLQSGALASVRIGRKRLIPQQALEDYVARISRQAS